MVSVTFSNGNTMPALGFGTFITGELNKDEVRNAVETAIDVGYRHIDGAAAYKNEDAVGNAIKKKIDAGVIKREELFVTSKLWNTFHRPGAVRPALKDTLNNLQLSYIDLYLIHWPVAFVEGEEYFPVDEDGNMKFANFPPEETWKAMEELVDEGLTKNIGLSNFNIQQIDSILKCARIKPANLQVEVNVHLQQEELVNYCKKKGITVTAYAPIGNPSWGDSRNLDKETSILEEPEIVAIAKSKGKTPAQIAIKFLLQRGLIVIPKSVKPARIKENFESKDVVLDDEDMKTIKSLNQNKRHFRVGIWKTSPYYPFKDEV